MTGRRQIPPFGDWDYYSDELPITQYFESAAHAGLIPARYFRDSRSGAGELLKIPSARPVAHPKAKRGSGGGARKPLEKVPRRKRRDVREVAAAAPPPLHAHQRRPGRAPKAVDEDLYKIPPELLYQKPKRNWFLRSIWPACLGINCIA